MKQRKYYVVFVGYRQGIFVKWSDAERQVHAYPGCRFKSYASLTEARTALSRFNGSKLSQIESRRNSNTRIKAKLIYVVFKGRRPGIYIADKNAKEQTLGYPGAMLKCYRSMAIAQRAYRNYFKSLKWYAVIRGWEPGIYKRKEEAIAQIQGLKDPICMECSSYEDAVEAIERFLTNYTENGIKEEIG
ncbi:MAG: viroplasmin family protein [Taibaiella sp.]|nr:viroplasmin family protein [Taibaiella sp.]